LKHTVFFKVFEAPKKKEKKGILLEDSKRTVRSIFTIGQMEKKKFKKNCAHFWAGQALFAPINFSALFI
jgi:hypothetical protein